MANSHWFFVYFCWLVKRVIGILLLISSNIFAQNIVGRVVDAESGAPIPFANVLWLKNQVGNVADLEGNFSISFLNNDTLQISVIGYTELKVASEITKTKKVFKVSKAAEVLKGVSIEIKRRKKRRKRKEDPAYRLHQEVAKNRIKNDIKKRPYYDCKIYNKSEIALNNVDSNTKNLLLFKPVSFVFDHPDTSSRKKAFSNIFISEAFSNYYYKKPGGEKEVIKASKNAGINIPSIAQYTGNVYTSFNIYENYIRIFQKQFISPLSKTSWLSYKYYITDSTIVGDTTYYRLEFRPRRDQDLAFEGYIITDDKSHGVSEVQFEIPKRCNINFVEEFVVNQRFKLLDTAWVLDKEDLLIDVNPLEKSYGFYINKQTQWMDFNFDFQGDTSVFGAQKTHVEDSAYKYGTELLERYRPDSLSAKSAAIYKVVDSAMNTRYLKTIQNLSQMLYTGYYPFKYWEYGPYYTTYSFNSLEGDRVRLGFQSTQALFENWRLRGHVAHGFGDGVTKYNGLITKYYGFKKWRYFEFEHLNDYKILSASDNAFQEDNILASLTRRVDPKYTHTKRTRFEWSHEWYNGINNSIELKTENLVPIGSLNYATSGGDELKELNVHTVKIGGRLAINECFVRYGFRRLSLSTRKPRFNYAYTTGVIVNGEGHEFHKAELEMIDRYYFGYFGFLDLKVFTGKIWGDVPYPLLLNHQGNDSYYYDNQAFNLMNPFEFASDQQLSVMTKYNFDGLIFNRIPLMKRLHLRSFLFANTVYGTMNNSHEDIILLPDGLSSLNQPYLETGFGVENIFKLIRLDFIWRLTNVSSPEVQKFGITFDIVPNF